MCVCGRDIVTYFMPLMIGGVIIPLASECLTKQHLCVKDSRHVFVWSGRVLRDTFGSCFDDLTDCMRVRDTPACAVLLLLHPLTDGCVCAYLGLA